MRIERIEALYEPCNCGSRCRHFNGGNYHERIYLLQYRGQLYAFYTDTREFFPSDNNTIYVREDGILDIDNTKWVEPLDDPFAPCKQGDMITPITKKDWNKIKKEKLREGWTYYEPFSKKEVSQ